MYIQFDHIDHNKCDCKVFRITCIWYSSCVTIAAALSLFAKSDMCYNILVLFYTSDLYGKMMYIELCIMIGVLQATHGTSTSDSTTSKRAVSHRDEMHKEFSNNTWINIAEVKEPMRSMQCSKCCCPVSDADASASESRGCLSADEIPVKAAERTRPADATSRHRRSLNLGQYIDVIYNGYATSYHDVDFSAHSYSDLHLRKDLLTICKITSTYCFFRTAKSLE